MSFTKIWIHIVFATKNREPFLTSGIRKNVINHIKENAINKNIYIDFINGYIDHLHCLISLKPDQSVSKVVNLIKGESFFWINKEKLINSKFAWQKEYYAASISESEVNLIREYIKNQKNHHYIKDFDLEYQEYISDYIFKKKKTKYIYICSHELKLMAIKIL